MDMSQPDQTTTTSSSAMPAPIPAAAGIDAEMNAMKTVVADYVRRNHDWYQARKRPNRIAHRVAGSLVVGLGAAIPLLSLSKEDWARVAVSVIGVAISAITGLGAFFRWERSWQSYSIAHLHLDYLLRRWQLAMAQANNTADPSERLVIARRVTQELLEEARKVQEAETSDFFQNVPSPKDAIGKAGSM